MRYCDHCGEPCDGPWFGLQYYRGASDDLLLPPVSACGRMCVRALMKRLAEENEARALSTP